MNNKTMTGKDSEIIQYKSKEVQKNLNQEDYLNHYIFETLESFAFRYFDEPLAPLKISKNITIVTALEKGIKKAIAIKNTELRSGIGELVKRVSRDQIPTILREIKVNFERNSNHNGTCQVSARISFGHPDHDFTKGTFVESLSIFKFADEFEFRNTLAKHLEIVCELF